MDRFLVETKIAADESGELSGLAWPFGTPDRVADRFGGVIGKEGRNRTIEWELHEPLLFLGIL